MATKPMYSFHYHTGSSLLTATQTTYETGSIVFEVNFGSIVVVEEKGVSIARMANGIKSAKLEGSSASKNEKLVLTDISGSTTTLNLANYTTTAALTETLNSYVTTSNLTTELGKKVDKVTNAVENNISTFGQNGVIKDSGIKITTSVENSDTSVPTGKAVKTAIDDINAALGGISVSGNLVQGTGSAYKVSLSAKYDDADHKIKFYNVPESEVTASSTPVFTVDASAFVVDGMIDNVTFDSTTNDLTITFNSAAGKQDITVPLDGLVDVYKADDTSLALSSDNTFSVKTEWLKTQIANEIKKNQGSVDFSDNYIASFNNNGELEPKYFVVNEYSGGDTQAIPTENNVVGIVEDAVAPLMPKLDGPEENAIIIANTDGTVSSSGKFIEESIAETSDEEYAIPTSQAVIDYLASKLTWSTWVE